MRTKKKLLVSALASAGALGLAALPATRALAAGPAPLTGLTSFHQLAVAGNDVFLTGAPDSGSGIVVTDLSGHPVATLNQGADVSGIALRGSTLYARLTSGSHAGSLAAIGLPSSGAAGTASFAEHYMSLLGGLLSGSLKDLASALGPGQTGSQVNQNVSAAGARATGAGSVIRVYSADGTLARVISLGDRTLAQGGLAWAGSTLIAVTKAADGLYGVRSFLDAAVRLVAPKATPSSAVSPGPASAKPAKPAASASRKMPATLTISAPAKATYEPTIAVKVHLGSVSANRTVSVYAQQAGAGKKLIKKGTVDLSGNLTVNYKTPYTTTFTAVFSGDMLYAAKTVTHTVTVVPKMSLAVNGWYGSAKVNGTTYREYHTFSDIEADLSVAPGKSGECVWFQVQEYYNGSWHANMKSSCVALNPASKLSGYLTVNNADRGYHYRIQAHYLPAESDHRNGATATAWQYLLPEG